jgi:membrane-bound metal-dependent hydrolase YbcI (DUF457 family)
MATPVAHLLAGAAIGIAFSPRNDTPRHAAVAALAAVAADFDFLPGLLVGAPSRFHHTQSHSLAFVALAAVLALLIAKKLNWHWGFLAGFAYLSHLVLDLLTFDDSLPQGIPLFWPFSAQVFQSPLSLFPNVPWGSGLVLSAHNIELLTRELGFLGPLLFAALAYAWWRRGVN